MNFKYGYRSEIDVYCKKLGPEHYFKKYQGFGINQEELEQAEKEGLRIIQIIYQGRENIEIYLTTTKKYRETGIPYNNQEEQQLILPTKQMERI